MHHTAAYFVSLSTTANTELDAVADQYLDRANDHFRLPKDMMLWAAYASSATLNRMRFRYPSINQYDGSWISPISATLLPPTDYNIADYRRNPFRIPKMEEIVVQATSDIAMGNENAYCVLTLGDTSMNPPAGDIYTIRGTSTTAGVAQTWTLTTVTWDIQLPDGTYYIVGGRLVSTTGVAWRVILQNQLPRPGALSLATAGLRGHEMFQKGGLGVWGQFTPAFMPQLEILDNATGNAHTLYLDCIRVR